MPKIKTKKEVVMARKRAKSKKSKTRKSKRSYLTPTGQGAVGGKDWGINSGNFQNTMQDPGKVY